MAGFSKIVTVFGSGSAEENSEEYKSARALGRLLAELKKEPAILFNEFLKVATSAEEVHTHSKTSLFFYN